MSAGVSVILVDCPGEESAHVVSVLERVQGLLETPGAGVEGTAHVPAPRVLEQLQHWLGSERLDRLVGVQARRVVQLGLHLRLALQISLRFVCVLDA